MVISLVNKKGGAAKSTSALYLACTLQNYGHKTCVIDFDPDATLFVMSKDVELGIPVFFGDSQNVKKQVEKLKEEYTHIVIDTPPNDEAIIMRVSGVSDEVIIPLAPTGFDLSRLKNTIGLIQEIESMRGKALLSILITRYRKGVKSNEEAIAVAENNELPLLKNRIRFLDRYTSYQRPEYMEEYETVLKELEIL